MKRFVHPLLLILARATEKELVQIVEYLKTENRMLRAVMVRFQRRQIEKYCT